MPFVNLDSHSCVFLSVNIKKGEQFSVVLRTPIGQLLFFVVYGRNGWSKAKAESLFANAVQCVNVGL